MLKDTVTTRFRQLKKLILSVAKSRNAQKEKVTKEYTYFPLLFVETT